MQFSISYILLILACCSESFLFTKLKQKLKAFLKGKTLSQISEFPLESSLEYPGNDPQLRWEIRQLWDDYYSCLEKKLKSLGSQKSVMPEAIMVFEGSSVRLDCKVCISPAELNTIHDVTWYYDTIPPNGSTLVEYGEHILLSPEDKVLHMYNLQQENSGQYFCKIGGTVMAPYFLEVANDSEPTVQVRPHTAPKAHHSQPSENVPGHNLEVFTAWEPWSPCSKCGEVGKRVRFGICTVKFLQEVNTTEKLPTGITNNTNETKNLNSNNTKVLESGVMKLLALFKKGIPCRSSLVPELQSIPQIQKRKSEIMMAFCKEPCTQESVFQIVDEKGKVVETANNSEGIYSSLQGIPPIPPSVERTTIYEDTSTYKIIIKCPGNLNTDTPVQWQIGTKNINPILIEKQSGGRIYIDMKDHINLKKPRPTDSNIYSCWQGKELAGTVRLVITKEVKLSLNHHVMLIGLSLITGTFLIVCFRVFKGRKKILMQ
ncbi:Ig-like V-type domain-containing protein FAM187A [Periplaneta americana]|uniref:Ig-like V-type domain-containing protein FAM187A n=1 Tax=Periplaneta americana TaxID=6978 RepID=UPI0037E8F9CF